LSDGGNGQGAARTRTMLRILVLAESLPYPTLKGGDLRTWQNVNALASFARVGVFGLCSNDRRRDRVPDLGLACWTTCTDPALTWPPPKGVKLDARAWLLDPRGHPSDLYFSDAAARELAAVVARIRPDVVLMEGLWLHGYLPVVRAAGRRVILDCHNVEAAVFRDLGRTNDWPGLEGRVMRDVLPARTEAIERSAVCAVDQLWICSEADQRRMREMYDPQAPSVVIPNGIRLEDYAASSADGFRPAIPAAVTLVFPGIFSYLPNAIAALFLAEEILPRLAAACGSCRLWLVGPMPPPELLAAAARDPRITVTGPVPDVRPYLAEATAMAAPLFHGGGTRLKVIEAFAAGLPVISTAKGAEGLDAYHGKHLLIAETAEEFVDAVLTLRRDGELAKRLAANAKALVTERLSWDTIGARIERAVAELGV
jgi:glycosyltransferase involved in cell wall biosynthesis